MFRTTIKRAGFNSRYSGTYEFNPRMYKNEQGDWIVDCGLGYKSWRTAQRTEGFDSVLKWQKYTLQEQILPKQGDVIEHVKSGRIFTIGEKISDFVVYTWRLMENGKQVAILRAEDYYKD